MVMPSTMNISNAIGANLTLGGTYLTSKLVLLAVGYKRNEPSDIMVRSGNPIHSRRITEKQLATIYSIVINDETIGKNFENFLNDDFLSKCFILIKKYAQGGMDILCKEVFDGKWGNSKLIREYHEYDVDLLRFIYTERVSDPF